MLFTEPLFLVFFAVVFGLYWSLRNNGPRKAVLLVASYVFYGAWDWRFLFLILASTTVDWLAGAALGRVVGERRRRLLLTTSVVTNLTILGFFKYFDFFVDSGVGMLRWLGLGVTAPALSIVLPVGISFFTFQSMSYTIDVYRRRLEPVRGFVDFFLFVAFFPQLVAGPIVRARELLPQLVEKRRRSDVQGRVMLTLFLVGFIKKMCIADNIGPGVEAFFAAPGLHSSSSCWLHLILFAAQVYCDFSGYSDMAVATAGLLGYRLPINFHFPYLASNVSDFWRRWHTSLSTWMRDYLYVPLGGNRGTTARTIFNVLVTMTLGGLWHGAAWTFVLFGAVHGMGLLVHRGSVLVRERYLPALSRGHAVRGIGTLATFLFFCATLGIFRAPRLAVSRVVLGRLFWPESGIRVGPGAVLGLAALLVVHVLFSRSSGVGFVGRWPRWVVAGLLGALTGLALPFVPLELEPFIYFQF